MSIWFWIAVALYIALMIKQGVWIWIDDTTYHKHLTFMKVTFILFPFVIEIWLVILIIYYGILRIIKKIKGEK